MFSKLSSWGLHDILQLLKFRRNYLMLLLLVLLYNAVLYILQMPYTVECQQINQPPYFVSGSGDMARFSLAENTAVGSPVYQLKGLDPEGSRLTYSISGPIFSVDRNTGVVRLRQELDRETQDTLEVIISITDESLYGTEPNTVSLRREIPVRDYNDNQPMFIGRPYLVNVSESVPVGSTLNITPPIIVNDNDIGVNAELIVKCVPENDICDIFEITAEEISSGNYTAQVILKKRLDYESRPNYILTISASDSAIEHRLTSFATISIAIIDMQDQLPIFTNAPYSAAVDENTPGGVSILTIKAIDGDIGIPRDIMLSLEDEIYGHFELKPFGDPKDGTAVLTTTDVPLDRENVDILENAGVYLFNVRAIELKEDFMPDGSSTTTTQITIVVNDVDDHLPEFSGDIFNISIPENLNDGMPLPGLTVFVNDQDMGNNSRYTLELRDVKNALNVFSVHPVDCQGRTSIAIRVLNSTSLDYDVTNEKDRQFSFHIVALVRGIEKAKTLINVFLIDLNDNSPIFEISTYHFKAAENLEPDSQIGSVNASDKDSGNFGIITYRLKGFGSDYFYIDSKTGGFFIQKMLDYEIHRGYSLTIVAEDGGGREANAQVYIDVIDINDNYPQFESKEYARTIREGTKTFEPQFIVRATDIDGPTQGGGRIRYSIVSENSISGNVFRLNEDTGEITLQKMARSMDTEKGEYELIISATDYGKPTLANTTKIFVRVGISGNQRPIFKGHFQNIENVPIIGPPSYRVSIPENAPAGYNVTIVSAHDPDGLDSELRYRIVGANDNFQINQITGLIKVSPQARIDRDSNMDSFEITVNAVDSGIPIPETATTTVYVNIKDINDEKPTFEQSSYIAYISERAKIGENVIQVKAIDKDLNSKLYYSIKDDIKATTKAGVSITNRTNYHVEDAFQIVSETGVVVVKGKLRHDAAAVIILPIEVRDLNAEVDPENQIDSTEVTIYVQSFKDTNPIFKNKGWTSLKPIINVHIMEEMPIESTLFTLQAEDPVTKNSIQSFHLIEPRELEYFYIQEHSGEVILRTRLDYEALKLGGTYFEFQIKINTADSERSTISKVNITVENVNDNSPIFEETSYRFVVEENKKHPLRIGAVKAVDKDAVLTVRDERLGYHKIQYTLQGEHSHLFEINKTSGDISIAPYQIIDRERTAHIHLQVKAEDSLGKPIDSKYNFVDVDIDISDVNDNAPLFGQKEYMAVIPENAPINAFVIKVSAIDLDDGPNGELVYEIIEENDDVKNLFKINKYSGELTTKHKLTGKGRFHPYQIRIRAQDNGEQIPKQKSLSSEANIIIYIGDVSANDGTPYFIEPKMGEVVNITENSPIGSPVFKVIANDPDDSDTPSGTLYYKILYDTSDAGAFKINENTGLITTTKMLDREIQDVYHIILEVSDDGQPRQSVTRILQVKVLDVDDHKPRFSREVDEGFLKLQLIEEQPPGFIVANFSAIDEDVEENAVIDYVIIQGNEGNYFTLERSENNTAILKTNRVIDREKIEAFTLTVKCLKFGEPSYIFIGDSYDRYDLSHLSIHIKVLDADDNLPQFKISNQRLGIRINTPLDTVITTIEVTDLDAEAQPILLTVDSVQFVPQFYKRSKDMKNDINHRIFLINNHTGELKTCAPLIDYVDGYFDIKIRANNSVNIQRHVFNRIQIFIIRDTSLLKFIFSRPANEIQQIIQPFQSKVQEQLKPLGLDIHIIDTQVLTKGDYSLDFTSTSSCFQMFRNGSTLPMHDMIKLMDSPQLKKELFDVYVEYGVTAVDSCSMRKVQAAATIMTEPGTWLVVIAALVGMAALITVCTACCLRKKYHKHSKRSLQASHATTESFGVSVPTIYLPYSEPMYGPL